MSKSYDLSKLVAMSGGNMAFVEKMVLTFISLAPQSIADINTALNELDYPKLNAAAHKLKPSLDFMGIGTLAQDIRVLELNVANLQNLETVPELVKNISETCLQACEEMKQEYNA